MDFSLSEEQRLIKESVDRFVADRYDFEARKKYLAEPDGFSRDNWGQFAELGLLGLPFDEADGGFGGGAVETAVVMEAIGRGIVVEPYLPTVVLSGTVLKLAANAEQRAAIIPGIVDGSTLVAFAYAEPGARYNHRQVDTTARKEGGGYVLNGKKAVVLGGAYADQFIVSARTGGDWRDPDSLSLFLVPKDAAGLTVRGYPTQDSLRAADLALENVTVGAEALLGAEGGAADVIEEALAVGIAAVCSEAVGAMESLNKLTLDYLKTRQQFGVTIGSFQALQHRMVDMEVALEEARSLALLSTIRVAEAPSAIRTKALHAAKIQIGKSGRHIGQEAIQLHGGIAMTREYSAGHFFMRLTMIDATFGDTDYHIERFGEAA